MPSQAGVIRGAELKWIRLRWEKESRYYEAHLHQDLWGHWILTRVWGQRRSALGRVRHIPCASYEEGLIQLDQVRKRRKQRGYRAILNWSRRVEN